MRNAIVAAMRCVLVAAFATAAVPVQAEWSLDDMNRTIEQTNFIVDNMCSGTLVGLTEKLVLTNYHCVDDHVTVQEREVADGSGVVTRKKFRKFEDVPVAQKSYDGFTEVGSFSYVSDIVAVNKQVDLALIKLKGKIPHTYSSPLLPNSQEVVRGERVYAVGNPALQDATVVEGIVSNVNRTFEYPWTNNTPLPMIQFSGGIFGGNSGGALYNGAGQLIGVPAAGYRQATFLGFAVPIGVIKKFLSDNCFTADASGQVVTDKECVAKKEKIAVQAKARAEELKEERDR